jgi:hypothetical protein
MQGIVEMLSLEQRRDAFQRLIVHQDRAEQRLLDFDIIGDVAISFVFHQGPSEKKAQSSGRKADGQRQKPTAHSFKNSTANTI